MAQRVIASYNMSFASDLGITKDKLALGSGFVPSEASFLSRANEPRQFWKKHTNIL